VSNESDTLRADFSDFATRLSLVIEAIRGVGWFCLSSGCGVLREGPEPPP
jgi:hypothetical protein